VGLRNTDSGYGSTARFFHWSIAFLILFQFVTIVIFRSPGQNPPDFAWEVLNWHKSSGLVILVLCLGRFAWRWRFGLPDWPSNFEEWDKKVSHFSEWGLYTSLFVMTLSGILIEITGGYYIPFFGLFSIDNRAPYFHPGAVSQAESVVAAREALSVPVLTDFFVALHVVFAYVLVALVAIHVAHVVRHQVGMRDGLLYRMWPRGKSKT